MKYSIVYDYANEVRIIRGGITTEGYFLHNYTYHIVSEVFDTFHEAVESLRVPKGEIVELLFRHMSWDAATYVSNRYDVSSVDKFIDSLDNKYLAWSIIYFGIRYFVGDEIESDFNNLYNMINENEIIKGYCCINPSYWKRSHPKDRFLIKCKKFILKYKNKLMKDIRG